MECRHVIGDVVQRSRGSRKRYSMCRGCGAVWVSRSYRYISLFWCIVESWSGAVMSPVHPAALGMFCHRCSGLGEVARGQVCHLWLPHRYPVVLQRQIQVSECR